MIDSIPNLIINKPKKGIEMGRCKLCGKKTDHGYLFNPSNSFVGYSKLYQGNLLCPYCHNFFNNQKFRHKHWIATKKQTIFPDRIELKKYLLKPPEPPFAVYITKSHQKQGWINSIKKVNYSKSRFYIITDFTETILADREKINKINKILIFLREQHNFSKKSLYNGVFSMKEYRKAIEKNFEEKLEKCKKWAGSPVWNVMVYVSK